MRIQLSDVADRVPSPKPASYEPGTYADRLPVHRGLPMPFPELCRLRESIFREHVTYQQGLLHFLSHDPAVPQSLRDRMAAWGLAPREFAATEYE